MKALTVCQPWAHAIIFGEKRIENRTWPTKYRGPLLIHSGKSRFWLQRYRSDLALGRLPRRDRLRGCVGGCPGDDDFHFGMAIGVVNLVGCFHIGNYHGPKLPFMHGPWCWVLQSPIPLREPIPIRGRQGIFTVAIDLSSHT